MREIITQSWCDHHDQNDGVKVEATVTAVIALDFDEPGEVDLCSECNDMLLGPIQTLLMRARQPSMIERANHKPGSTNSYGCPLCDRAPYTNRNSLVEHVWRDHAHQTRPKQPPKCPNCPMETRPPGMARHRAMAHGYDMLTEALEAVNQPARRRSHG